MSTLRHQYLLLLYLFIKCYCLEYYYQKLRDICPCRQQFKYYLQICPFACLDLSNSAIQLQIHNKIILERQQSKMKQLLQTIWNFVRKIPKRFTKIIQHNKKTEKIENSLDLQEVKHTKQTKIKRKRRSFKSFIHQEKQQNRHKTSSAFKKKNLKGQTLYLEDQLISSSNIQSQHDYSEPESMHKIESNEQIDIKINERHEFEAIFEDNNGMEISMIDQGRINQSPEIKQSDSEVQLIRLISGQSKSLKQNITRKFQQISLEDRFKKKQKIQWWQKIVEGAKQSYAIKKQFVCCQSYDQVQSIAKSISDVQITKKFKIRPRITKTEENVRQHRIKVINLIDLVENEDSPKLYQIPLSVKVYD